MPVLLLREGYEADGWLGLLLGTSLWYGLFGQTLEPGPFERKMDDLARELGPRGRLKIVDAAVEKLKVQIELPPEPEPEPEPDSKTDGKAKKPNKGNGRPNNKKKRERR